MASASYSYYILYVFALLCMCFHLCAGAPGDDRSQNSTSRDSNPQNSTLPPPSPSPSPSPSAPPSPSPSSSPSPLLPSPSSSPSPISLESPESAKHKRGRILGLVLISFAGALQAFVVLFLFFKRRQMLKHVRGSRNHHDPPHIWPNA